ncbi:MAG: BsaWI family type II restriction enzyme [Methanoregula sp.]|nr:BsaWI family type II restriction enzyme [Methanoregula sp.]
MANLQDGAEKNSDAQGRRSKAGNKFELEVYEYLNKELGDHPKIRLLRPRTQVYLPGSRRKCPFCCMQINTSFGDIIGDTDIVVYHVKRNTPLIIVSCKTSIRERLASSLYNLHLYRKKYPDIKLFFVTKDNDLEFGKEKKPNKNRILAISEGIFCYSQNPKTDFGGCIHPYENMIVDIKRMAGIEQKKKIRKTNPASHETSVSRTQTNA